MLKEKLDKRLILDKKIFNDKALEKKLFIRYINCEIVTNNIKKFINYQQFLYNLIITSLIPQDSSLAG